MTFIGRGESMPTIESIIELILDISYLQQLQLVKDTTVYRFIKGIIAYMLLIFRTQKNTMVDESLYRPLGNFRCRGGGSAWSCMCVTECMVVQV